MDNLGHMIVFELDDEHYERRLVPHPVRALDQISVTSPVGEALRDMSAGEAREMQIPDGIVYVKVLSVL